MVFLWVCYLFVLRCCDLYQLYVCMWVGMGGKLKFSCCSSNMFIIKGVIMCTLNAYVLLLCIFIVVVHMYCCCAYILLCKCIVVVHIYCCCANVLLLCICIVVVVSFWVSCLIVLLCFVCFWGIQEFFVGRFKL